MLPRHVLLLATAHSYRLPAFEVAAARLGVRLSRAVDAPAALAGADRRGLRTPFRDEEAALAAIAAFARDQPVAAILPVDDAGALLAARAGALLGLPYNAPQAAQAARDKAIMRDRLAAAGVPVPAYRRVSLDADPAAVAGSLSYPCVVKPTRLSGSRGVIRVDDGATFVSAFRRVARLLRHTDPDGPGELLVEAFVPGVEVALEGLLGEEGLATLALFDKPDPLDGPYFEETIYVTPSRLPATDQAAIAECAAAAAAALGLRRGPIHAELRLNEDGPWLIEAAGRSIGGLCSEVLRFGVDSSLEELILRQACGLPMAGLVRERAARGVMMIPIPRAGMFRGVAGIEEAAAVPGVDGVKITAPFHNPLVPLPDGESYLGFIFARGETPAAAEASLRAAHRRLRFAIDPIVTLLPTGDA